MDWDDSDCCIWDQFGMQLELTNGYRQDRLSTKVASYVLPSHIGITDRLKIHDLSFYQLGLNGRFTLGDWIARLEGDIGWGGGGKYHETVSISRGGSIHVRAHTHDNRVRDLIIGGGYLMPLGCMCDSLFGFKIGPLAGWSYDHQRIKLKHTKIEGRPIALLNGVQYKNRWQGPWLGFEATYDLCAWEARLGYEYHWSHFHALWALDGSDGSGTNFSNRRKSDHAYGNVVYLDAHWNFCSIWNLGFGFKYQSYRANKGSERPMHRLDDSSGSDTPFFSKDKLKHANWTSYAVTFDIGASF